MQSTKLMFSFIKEKLQKVYSSVTSKLHSLFSGTIDHETLQKLERILLEADTGRTTTRTILHTIEQQVRNGSIAEGHDLQQALEKELLSLMHNQTKTDCSVILLVGINGSGKTTCAAKLAHTYSKQGKRVLLVAADTFRAAATDQLAVWAEKAGSDIVIGSQGQDPASVVYQGCEKFKNENYDVVIIDTAGRLQTKVNLMNELTKIKKIVTKVLPTSQMCTLLTIDAMLGQNSFDQAKLFHESTNLDGIILTKMDGTAKGGIVFAINNELHLPVYYISFGEQLEQLKKFDANVFVHELLHT